MGRVGQTVMHAHRHNTPGPRGRAGGSEAVRRWAREAAAAAAVVPPAAGTRRRGPWAWPWAAARCPADGVRAMEPTAGPEDCSLWCAAWGTKSGGCRCCERSTEKARLEGWLPVGGRRLCTERGAVGTVEAVVDPWVIMPSVDEGVGAREVFGERPAGMSPVAGFVGYWSALPTLLELPVRSIGFWRAGWAPPWTFALPLLLVLSALFGAARKNERMDET